MKSDALFLLPFKFLKPNVVLTIIVKTLEDKFTSS